jgi:hypothetical protein
MSTNPKIIKSILHNLNRIFLTICSVDFKVIKNQELIKVRLNFNKMNKFKIETQKYQSQYQLSLLEELQLKISRNNNN